MANVLNVIFHGLWVFVPRKGFIEVIAPKIPFHIYEFGEWLCEEPLPEGLSEFKANVSAGAAGKFDFTQNLVFGSATINGNSSLRHATLKFPIPHAIISERTEPLQANHFSSPPGPTVKGERVSEVQVFKYEVADFKNISLGAVAIDVASFKQSGITFANLHFFADSPRTETEQEGEQASYIACNGILNSAVWLKDSPEVENLAVKAPGCFPAELLPLSARNRKLAQAVNVWRSDPESTGQALLNTGFNISGRPNCDSVIGTEEPLP